MTDYSFSRYLLAKQSVDDRALNKNVLTALQNRLPKKTLAITEVGAGIGTMLTRMLRWNVIDQAAYTLVDAMPENIAFARHWLPAWGRENGYRITLAGNNTLSMQAHQKDVRVQLVQADVFKYIEQNPARADLLIANAFLDLLPLPESLPQLMSLTRDIAWLTINFDGVSTLEPLIDPELDAKIERLYHQTMDTRPGGGDSHTGRHLFGYLHQSQIPIIAAGASDWVVHAVEGRYPADEAYFLHFILHFFEEALKDHPEIKTDTLASWLKQRHGQIASGQLVYIAHQMDFLVRNPL